MPDRSLFLVFLLLGCAGTAPLPPKALALNDAGAEALAAGDLETADARLSLALEYSPRFVEALVNLALVECQRGNFTRARQLLLRARRINPDVAQPHHGLGVLAERERRPDRASEFYLEALRVDPGFAPARANLGRLQFNAGKLESAFLSFRKLVEAAPDQADGYVGLAETLLRLGRVDEAERITNEAVERFPNEPRVTLLQARAELRHGQVERAIQRLLPLGRGRDEFAASALGWLATAELARNQPRRAIGAASRALALEPSQGTAALALARALAELGDPAAALWAEKARQLGTAQ